MRVFLLFSLLTLSFLFTSCSDNSEPEFSPSSSEEFQDIYDSLTDEEKIEKEQEELAEIEKENEKRIEDGSTVLRISSPREGLRYETDKTYIVLWGDIINSENVKNIQVNGYTLQKYPAGARKFSYIASTSIGTLERGQNFYHIQALDEAGNILAETEYVIISDVKYSQLSHTGPRETFMITLLIAIASTLYLRRNIFI